MVLRPFFFFGSSNRRIFYEQLYSVAHVRMIVSVAFFLPYIILPLLIPVFCTPAIDALPYWIPPMTQQETQRLPRRPCLLSSNIERGRYYWLKVRERRPIMERDGKI